MLNSQESVPMSIPFPISYVYSIIICTSRLVYSQRMVVLTSWVEYMQEYWKHSKYEQRKGITPQGTTSLTLAKLSCIGAGSN